MKAYLIQYWFPYSKSALQTAVNADPKQFPPGTILSVPTQDALYVVQPNKTVQSIGTVLRQGRGGGGGPGGNPGTGTNP